MLFSPRFRIPNLLRDLFAEGALSAAFVTTFTQVQQTKGAEEAFRLSNRVATALMISVEPDLRHRLDLRHRPSSTCSHWFFGRARQADLTIHLTRIMIPFLLLSRSAAKAWEILERAQHFGHPGPSPQCFSIWARSSAGCFLGFTLGIFSSQCHRRHGIRHPRRRFSSLPCSGPVCAAPVFRYRPC